MTHNKANKSKILALILGLTMCISLMLGIATASPANTARAEETDTRIVVSTITANSNVDDIVGFGKSVVRPTFNIVEDVPARFSTSGNWKRKTATGGWENYSGTEFTEGVYRYSTQIRIDSNSGGGTTHVLNKNGITVTVNGVKWADNSKPSVSDTFSYDWVFSKEYPVVAPAGTPLDFIKNNNWDIEGNYINQPITSFTVVDGAVGGTKPYTFSKVSGPEWIAVAADGTVSGTPTVLGANADLVIKVTDSAVPSDSKEITLNVGNTNVLPADRIKISEIHATSDVDDIIGFGKSVVKPTFNIVEDVPARFSPSGYWQRKTATGDWEEYSGTTFTEGTYRYRTQIRFERNEGGSTHVLDKNGITVTVNGVKWADNSIPIIDDTYSFDWVFSKEYEVVKPTAVAITDELVPVTDLEKVFNETAQEPTFGGTLVRGTDFEVSYAVKAGSTGALDINGKPVNAGTYVVTVTGKGAYEGSFTKELVINKAAQTDVPVGIIANPISCRDGSGTIIGVTTAMEYRKVGDAGFTACTSSTIANLEAGEYEVRYAEDDNYLASGVATVTIAISHNLGTLNEESPATCIAGGMQAHYYCSDCGKFFDESKKETTEAALTIPATGVHTFGELVAEKPATCIAGGMQAHYKCTECGKFFDAHKNETTEEALTIHATGVHAFGELVAEKPATCIAGGMQAHYKCTECGKYFDADKNETTEEALTIPANDDHDWNVWESNGDGTHTRTCKRDRGHKENGNCSGGAATCENKAVCSVCGEAYGGKLGHDYGEVKYTWTGNDACKAERVCKRDNAHVESETATATAEEITAATCKEKGKMKYTATFENAAFAMQEKEVDTDLVPHSFGDRIDETPATCIADGMKAHYYCSVCDKYFDESKTEKTVAELTIPVNPNAHDFEAWIAEDPATCVATGTKGHKDCRICNKNFDGSGNEITDLTISTNNNHDWNAWSSNGNGTHTRTCKRDRGHKENGNCSGGTATCVNKAVCSVCGEAYGGKLGHDYGRVKYTWTGDNICKAERVCKRDNAHVEKETVKATAEEIKAATCKEKGKMKYTATFVNVAFAMQEKEVDTDFAPHTYGDWIKEIPATTEEFGTKGHKDCTVCGKHFDNNGIEITELTIEKLPSDVKDSDSSESVGEVIEPKKDGLSGGQVAGIVIGSAAVAGIGGFAIFWFAVKKKTFADLGVALKKGFTAIGNFFKTLGAKIKALFTKKK